MVGTEFGKMKPTAPTPTPTDNGNNSYTSGFYSGIEPGALRSARVILGVLFEAYRPNAVLDIGCGQGAWLAAAEELGCSHLVGIDGPWVNAKAMLSRRATFSAVDLEGDISFRDRFDLCICLEVAEHLSPARAPGFVDSLCSASDVILFSAAIMQQGGTNHINERWQSFWAGLFKSAGFECYDLIRPKIWTDDRVDSWYRQNVLLYINQSSPVTEAVRRHCPDRGPLDIVHPDIYEGNLETFKRMIERPSLRFCREIIARWCRRQIADWTRPYKQRVPLSLNIRKKYER
jgi:SAM-dependent methyltransferase